MYIMRNLEVCLFLEALKPGQQSAPDVRHAIYRYDMAQGWGHATFFLSITK